MLALDFGQVTESRAERGFSSEDTQISAHLCMALGVATHLAHTVQFSDDAIARAYDALRQALRLNPTVHTVQPIAAIHIKQHSRSQVTQIRRSQPCPRDERSDDGSLSARQQNILELIATGLSNKEIARSLGISPETVKTHVTHIFIKLKVERRAQAVAFAQTCGMIHNATSRDEA